MPPARPPNPRERSRYDRTCPNIDCSLTLTTTSGEERAKKKPEQRHESHERGSSCTVHSAQHRHKTVRCTRCMVRPSRRQCHTCLRDVQLLPDALSRCLSRHHFGFLGQLGPCRPGSRPGVHLFRHCRQHRLRKQPVASLVHSFRCSNDLFNAARQSLILQELATK